MTSAAAAGFIGNYYFLSFHRDKELGGIDVVEIIENLEYLFRVPVLRFFFLWEQKIGSFSLSSWDLAFNFWD